MSSDTSYDASSYAISPVDDRDHAGYVLVTTICSIIYTIIAATTRGIVKKKVYDTDDYLLFAATVSADVSMAPTLHNTEKMITMEYQATHLGQSIVVFYGLGNGLGKFNTITKPENWPQSGKVGLERVTLDILKPPPLSLPRVPWPPFSSPECGVEG